MVFKYASGEVQVLPVKNIRVWIRVAKARATLYGIQLAQQFCYVKIVTELDC